MGVVRVGDDALTRIVRAGLGAGAGLVRAVPLPGGQVNDTRLLDLAGGQRAVLRVAPSPEWAAAGPGWLTPWGLRREAAVIAAAHELADLLPVTLAHDFSGAVVERDWVIQAVMPGVPLSSLAASMDHHGQRQAWREVGAFTRRLHAVRGPHFGPPAWGTAFERWSDLLAADIEGFIDDADRLGLPQAPFVRLRGAVARLASVLDEGTEPRLVHSDLWASHLFIEQGEAGPCLAGVIDLDFGRYADPLAEHLLPSFALHNVPGPMQASFLEGYGPWQPPAGLEVRILVYRALGLAWDVTLRAFQDQETQTSTEDLIDVVEELEMTEPGAGLPAPG